jgi:DNA repair exonuclease SbcCD nuclease subunit
MKIAIISDWHLGYKWGSDLQTDSYSQLEQAFEQISNKDVDLVLCSGDLFDKKDPSPDEIYECIKILKNVKLENKIDLENNKEKLKIPMISIIGNHEYRGQDYKSVVHLLEIFGFLKFIHLSSINIEDPKGKDIEVFGMSGIPDKYALDVLKKWNPIANINKYSILLLHQTIKEYIPVDNEMIASISISNLPKNFELIINGHIHYSSIEQINNSQTLLLPGSTIFTQNKKIESKKPKGIYYLNTITNNLEFEEIKNARSVFYIDLKINEEDTEEIENKIHTNIKQIIGKIKEKEKEISKKPIVRLRLKGKLKKGSFSKNLKLNNIIKNYEDSIYLNIVNNIEETKLKESIQKLKELQMQNKDLESLSKELFNKQIKKTNISDDFDYNRIFDILDKKDYLKKIKEIIYES